MKVVVIAGIGDGSFTALEIAYLDHISKIFFFQFENLFSSNSYTKDLEAGDEKAGGDTLGKVRPGYQPVPQHPPPGYPPAQVEMVSLV